MAAQAFKQDMPPPGGYAKINFKHIPARPFPNKYKLFGTAIALSIPGLYMYWYEKKILLMDRIENNGGNIALYPLLLAERDREYLKQIKKNVEAEKDLMKDDKDWEVGTLYGEPIYKTLPKNKWVDPIKAEYFGHTNPGCKNQMLLYPAYVP